MTDAASSGIAWVRQRRAAVGREWTAADDAELVRLAAVPCTGAEAAAVLGRSRSAVLGRAARIGLTFNGGRRALAPRLCCPSCGRRLPRAVAA